MTSAGGVPDITLRDIHVPAGVAVWPPGPGWWLLLALIVVAAMLLAGIWWYRCRGPTLPALAQRRFEIIAAPDFGDSFARFAALHALLRRLAHACPGGDVWAADTSGQWLDWLSRQAGLSGCPPALATQVASVPFQSPHAVDVEPLINHARAIIRGLPRLRAAAPRRF